MKYAVFDHGPKIKLSFGETIESFTFPEFCGMLLFTSKLYSSPRRPTMVRNFSVTCSVGIYAEETLHVTETFRTIVGLRGDEYNFDVNSNIPQNSGKVDDSIVSPKLSFIFGPWSKTEYFINYGTGFQRNDPRGPTITVEPTNPSTPADK